MARNQVKPRIPNWKRLKPRVHLTPDVVEAFREYHAEHPEWEVFHCVLSDGNVSDDFADFRLSELTFQETMLAGLLVRMSPTQRRVIGRWRAP